MDNLNLEQLFTNTEAVADFLSRKNYHCCPQQSSARLVLEHTAEEVERRGKGWSREGEPDPELQGLGLLLLSLRGGRESQGSNCNSRDAADPPPTEIRLPVGSSTLCCFPRCCHKPSRHWGRACSSPVGSPTQQPPQRLELVLALGVALKLQRVVDASGRSSCQGARHWSLYSQEFKM